MEIDLKFLAGPSTACFPFQAASLPQTPESGTDMQMLFGKQAASGKTWLSITWKMISIIVGEGQEALRPGTRMVWPLTIIAMRDHEHKP